MNSTPLQKFVVTDKSFLCIICAIAVLIMGALFLTLGAIRDTKKSIRADGHSLGSSLRLLLWSCALVVLIFIGAIAAVTLAVSMIAWFCARRRRVYSGA